MLKTYLQKIITLTPIQYFPVTVQKGLAKGAKWTFFPYSSYWRGDTEMDVESAIRQHGSIRGATCWDLGTHYGIYTVGMAMAVGKEGRVVGFEPDSSSFKRCELHVKMNKLSQVKLFNAAVSDSEGESNLILSQGAGASTSHLAYEDEDFSKASPTLSVKTLVLDKLVLSGEIQPPAFIKIDVEGHGAKAIAGAKKTITKHLPTIVMSFHSQWELTDTQAILQPLGYRSFSPDGDELGWENSIFKTTILRC